MLDEMRMPASEATAGFPSHPHRGFETCSIMLSGKMEHRDSSGNHVSAPAGRPLVHHLLHCITDKLPP
jgi:redox-sensitive bicupin YhaK (pirin superfamily)